ncbi:hypothetical protein M3Y95_00144300 [Aphelenchoides besseyi]|nr:hypothetical protein M3Y95_00144300 [Aphelenchoides besseyi]
MGKARFVCWRRNIRRGAFVLTNNQTRSFVQQRVVSEKFDHSGTRTYASRTQRQRISIAHIFTTLEDKDVSRLKNIMNPNFASYSHLQIKK